MVEDSKLKFDERVPVEEVYLPCPEALNLKEEEYDVIGENVTYRLVHRPGLHVVRKYVQQVVKLKSSSQIKKAPLPELVIPGSFADTTFLAGLAIEKLLYYMPLYRQHQRLTATGVHIHRGTLTKLFHRVAELVEPIYHAQLSSILQSKVLTMDDTKVKAGRAKGKMKQGYFWPLYGDNDEIVFLFSSSRGGSLIKEQLQNFEGTLVTDGYAVYERYALARCGITHAQCWSHTRRKFVEAEKAEPELVDEVLTRIRLLYAIEDELAHKPLEKRKKLRVEKSKRIVEAIFSLVKEKLVTQALLPSNPFTKAARYILKRNKELSVFLDDPAVPLDSNHLERQIRPIAMGRKNWMFCSIEAGARKVGILQSLISTCKMHGVDPFEYLVDVLPRVSEDPASKVHLLTPRLWRDNRQSSPTAESTP